MYVFCKYNLINGDGKIDQDIIVDDLFNLCGRATPKVLLEASIFV